MVEPYGVGTVSVANGGTTVTGTGTFWVGKVRKNDLFTVPAQGLFARVTADPTNNDELAINGWPGTDLVDAEYEIISTYIAVDTASRTRELLLGLSLIDPNYDVQVDVLADRDAYDDRPGPTPTERGFAVLVSDIGDGRSAIYSKVSNASADWSDAAYFSGPTGGKGWSPQLVAESDGARRVLKLAGYVGGEGAEPTDNVGEYLKADGTFTATIGDAVDIRGEGFVFRGAYGNGTTYSKNDVAREAGSSWILTADTSTGNAPPTLPTTSNAYWQLLARQGNDGAGTVSSVVAGDGIAVDNSDPTAPVISSNTSPEGRLSLTVGVAVPEADVAGATAIHYVPNGGTRVPIFDGARFVACSIGSGLSMALDATSGHAGYHESGKNFDLFAINDGGIIRLGTGPSWIAGAVAGSGIVRGTGAGSTELEEHKGLLVNKNIVAIRFGSSSGNTVSVSAQRATYLGSFRAVANGQASDTKSKRLLFNAFNRVIRPMKVTDPAASWTYNTNVLRPANNNSAMRLAILNGLSGVYVEASYSIVVGNSTEGSYTTVAIGLNSTVTAGDSQGGTTFLGTPIRDVRVKYQGYPGLGFHELIALESSNAVGTTTFYSTGNNFLVGLFGSVAV